ncbi:MAG TPA: SDR family NAD(P)-dependent oxidoreductase, partial [Bacteroidales bacterium]|nr:SDR family NAD(P)-dependent oxidoreductase [Bacteroidales bacterium]
MQQKTAIIIGASSGIGRALAKELVKNQYKVAILSRRVELLNELKAGNPSNYVAKYFDITDIANIDILLDNITKELGSIDLLVISAGVGHS